MTKLLYVTTACLLVGACVGKQPIDPQYYHNTTWARGAENVGYGDGRIAGNQTAYSDSWAEDNIPSSQGAGADEKWQDPQTVQKVAVPAVAEKKLKCIKKGESYTCRYGQTICGTGCRADGSNCYDGYCLESDCDDVMGQKWEWVKIGTSTTYYGCRHPSYNVTCFPYDTDGITCITDTTSLSSSCGKQCNKNGTDCARGDNNCWDRYR